MCTNCNNRKIVNSVLCICVNTIDISKIVHLVVCAALTTVNNSIIVLCAGVKTVNNSRIKREGLQKKCQIIHFQWIRGGSP